MYKQWVKLGFPWNWLGRLNAQWKIINQRTHEGCRQKLFATVEVNKGNESFPKWQIWYSGAKIGILPGIATAIRSRLYHFLFTLKILMAWGGGCFLGMFMSFSRLFESKASRWRTIGQKGSGWFVFLFVSALETEQPVCISSHVFGVRVWIFCIFQLESFLQVFSSSWEWRKCSDSQRGRRDQASKWSQ